MNKERIEDGKGLSLKDKEDYQAYINYKRLIDNPYSYRSEIYQYLKSELSDIPFLKLQLGIFYSTYIEDIYNKRNEFEKATLKYLEEKDISGIPRKAILKLKSEVELMIQEIAQIENISKTELKDSFPFYCEIGALFAQGFISKKVKKGSGYIFYYKDIPFKKIVDISNYIQNQILNTDKSVRQYLSATFNERGQKNFFKSKKEMKKIIDYCEQNDYVVTQEFNTAYKKLH